MSDLNMDAALPPLDLSRVPSTFIIMMLQSMSFSDRFTCALVCKAWAQEAAAATHSIILKDRMQDLSRLQRWLEKRGQQLQVLQLHQCPDSAVLTALPCPQLRDLLLRGGLSLDGSVWSGIAAATKLTSVLLESVRTTSRQADVVSALTALPDLEQLTWSNVRCRQQQGLTDSKLLRKLTKLTSLKLNFANTKALKHLGLLTRLQDLSLALDSNDWDAAADPVSWQQVFPGPGRLPHLTLLKFLHPEPDLQHADMECVVACCSSLQVLHLGCLEDSATPPLTRLSCLTSLALGSASDQHCSSLAQLTGLRELRVHDASKVSAAGYRQLAALEQLTSLGLWIIAFSVEAVNTYMSDVPSSYGFGIINKAPAGQPPDVSARLRWACDMAAAAADS